MNHTRHSQNFTLPFALVFFFLLSGCAASEGDEIRTFLLQTDRPDVVQTAERLTEAVSAQLEGSQSLGKGYPILSRVEFEPDSSNPGAQKMRCPPTQAEGSATSDCILLNERGDFVRVQPITWQSAAFYMYRVYVAPEGFRVTVDPTKGFVALDVFVLEEVNLWEAVDQAIRESAAEIGAHPFRP